MLPDGVDITNAVIYELNCAAQAKTDYGNYPGFGGAVTNGVKWGITQLDLDVRGFRIVRH